jgi:hypothetical protein
MSSENETDRQRLHEETAKRRSEVAMPFLMGMGAILAVAVVAVVARIALKQRASPSGAA